MFMPDITSFWKISLLVSRDLMVRPVEEKKSSISNLFSGFVVKFFEDAETISRQEHKLINFKRHRHFLITFHFNCVIPAETILSA